MSRLLSTCVETGSPGQLSQNLSIFNFHDFMISKKTESIYIYLIKPRLVETLPKVWSRLFLKTTITETNEVRKFPFNSS